MTYELLQITEGQVSLTFFGTVVDGNLARLSSSTCVPLNVTIEDNAVEEDVVFWLDGSSYANPHRSDLCAAWLAKGIPREEVADADWRTRLGMPQPPVRSRLALFSPCLILNNAYVEEPYMIFLNR